MKSERIVITINTTTGQGLVYIMNEGLDESSLFPALVGSTHSIYTVWLVIMNKSCLLWIGDGHLTNNDPLLSSRGGTNDPSLSSLVVGMPAMSNSTDGPLSTTLIGSNMVIGSSLSDELGESMARRIAQRLKIQVFVTEQIYKTRDIPETLMQMEKLLVGYLSERFNHNA